MAAAKVPVRPSEEGHGDARDAEEGCLGSINHSSATSGGVGWRGLVVVGLGWAAIASRLGGRNGDGSSHSSRDTAQARASLVASGNNSSGSLGHRPTCGEGHGAVGGLDDGAIVHRIDVESYLVSIRRGKQREGIISGVPSTVVEPSSWGETVSVRVSSAGWRGRHQ